MPIDALAGEPQFLAHLAPTWRALPDRVRGRFLVPPELVENAAALGINAEPAQFTVGTYAPADPPPRGPKALVASYGDMKKGRRLGYGDFARFEHGIGQSYGTTHPSYAGGLDAGDVSLFLMPNEYSASRWRSVYPDAQVVVVGSPRLDALPVREPGPGPVIAISFHWRCSVAPETQPATTFLSQLPALVEKYTVLGHGHPRIVEDLRRYYRRCGAEVVTDFDDVCRRADLYVCDNSSSMYEFAATGRPVLTLNAPEYRRRVHHGLRFWEAVPGLSVDQPKELLPAVEAALADPPEARGAREAALALVYAHRSGAARRAAQRLSAWDLLVAPDRVYSPQPAAPQGVTA